MAHDSDGRRSAGAGRISRRTTLSGAAALASGGFAGIAGGQTDAEETTLAALSTADLESGAEEGLTGAFVRVRAELESAGDESTGGEDVDACEFLETDGAPAAYEADLIRRSEGDGRDEREVTIYGRADEAASDDRESALSAGDTYVINTQQACGDAPYVEVALEEVEEEAIEGPETTEPAPTDDGDRTATESPGFTALGALVAVGGVALAALRRAT